MIKTKTKYRVKWQHKTIPGNKGHGEWIENYIHVADAVEIGNKNYPNVKHWIENDQDVK